MFERILVGGQWFAAFFDFLAHDHAIRFEVSDAFLIGTNDGFAVRFNKPIHELSDLALDLRKLGLHRLPLVFHGFRALLPQVFKQCRGKLEKLFCRAQRL
ncbi:hypothetical protein DU478_07050 [Thalassococcus profundi]|uniref:Uncharacterized protein n=1 Tax=Thalassococcus profundi TaxID=2282382 RepID=A0A369TRW3_9RHOB|nr:hypothetical protein [Thalassococcus profundi]RDD67464.1 hypothetical protein DU478_07050 [Thalassococcus profundi]